MTTIRPITVAIIGYVNLNETNGIAPVSLNQNKELMLSDKDLEILDNLEILKENANTYLREIKNGRICPGKKKKKHVGNISRKQFVIVS